MNYEEIEININEKELCVKLVIYKDCTEMHGQQNIKDKNQSTEAGDGLRQALSQSLFL